MNHFLFFRTVIYESLPAIFRWITDGDEESGGEQRPFEPPNDHARHPFPEFAAGLLVSPL